jgi:hypothetical protein
MFAILSIMSLPVFASSDCDPVEPEDLCSNCITIAGTIETEIITNAPLIEHAINATFCNSRACSLFVMEYFPILIKVLMDTATPEAICSTLGWCNGTDAETQIMNKLLSEDYLYIKYKLYQLPRI